MEPTQGIRMCTRTARRTARSRRAAVARMCRAGCALLISVASISVTAEASFAGTYVMRSCNVPGQAPAPMGPWRSEPAPTTVLVDNCSTGGGFDFTLPWARTMGNSTDARLSLDAPTDPGRRAIRLERIRFWIKARLTGIGEPLRFYSGGPISWYFSQPNQSPIEPSADYDLPRETSALYMVLHCGGDADRPRAARLVDPDCHADADVPLEVRGIELTLHEDVTPAGSAVGGTLLGDKPVSVVRSLDYYASDAQSGVARVEAVIGDTVVAARDLAGRCSFADWSACPTTDRDTLSVDTRSVPDGLHALVLRTIDAAGNRHDEKVKNIEVRNTPAAGPPAIGSTSSAELTARFAGSSRSSLIVPWGRRVMLRGTLKGLARLAGERIDVFERAATRRARDVAVGSAQTRVDGTFSYTLASMRPSRTVRLAYGSAVAPPLHVRVRAASTLRASLRGTTLRYSGRVLSRPLPPPGKRVIIQGTAPGHTWAPFARLRTDRRGRFSGTYRLRAHRAGVSVQIRVIVPTQRSYPYLAYTGRVVTLRVR